MFKNLKKSTGKNEMVVSKQPPRDKNSKKFFRNPKALKPQKIDLKVTKTIQKENKSLNNQIMTYLRKTHKFLLDSLLALKKENPIEEFKIAERDFNIADFEHKIAHIKLKMVHVLNPRDIIGIRKALIDSDKTFTKLINAQKHVEDIKKKLSDPPKVKQSLNFGKGNYVGAKVEIEPFKYRNLKELLKKTN